MLRRRDRRGPIQAAIDIPRTMDTDPGLMGKRRNLDCKLCGTIQNSSGTLSSRDTIEGLFYGILIITTAVEAPGTTESVFRKNGLGSSTNFIRNHTDRLQLEAPTYY